MRIIIGTMFAGQIKSLHQQYISTKLFFFIIPIFPTMSMLVVNREFLSGRKGIEIPMNKLSTIAAYMRIISIPVAVLLYLLIDDLTSWQKISALLLSISLLVYVWFFFGKSSAKENFTREQMGKLFEIFFMPEWLYYEDLEKFQEKAMENYKQIFGDEDWESKLITIKTNDQMFPLVYSAAYLTIQLNDLDNKRDILNNKYYEYLQS